MCSFTRVLRTLAAHKSLSNMRLDVIEQQAIPFQAKKKATQMADEIA